MLPCTALIKYHHQAHQHTIEVTPLIGMIGPPLGITAIPDILTMITRIGTGLVVPNPPPHNHGYRSSSCSRSFHRPSWHSYSCHRNSSSYCYCHDTPHHRSSSHRIFSEDDSRSWTHKSQKQHYKPAQGSSSDSQVTPCKHKDRRHKQVTIDDPSSEYYSSDDQDSDSKDDLN